ncbi:glycosyltransferase family 4 protein [Pseudomonas sp. CR3202]|uniref:glycosyltransferase family 4 protein n=1 Tax=Pseudomonas sp. CR3202 TaxID=3351532 RepID=UPI003BF1F5C0
MEKIFILTSISKRHKYLLGPALVATELFGELRRSGKSCSLVDTYSTIKFGSFAKYALFFTKLVFYKRATVFVHAPGFISPLLFCALRYIRPSHSIIYTVHGLPLEESISNNCKPSLSARAQEVGFRLILALAKKIVFVSNRQLHHIEKNYPINAMTTAIHNGVATNKHFPTPRQRGPSNAFRAVMAGGLSARKSTIETAELINAKNRNGGRAWDLDIYGPEIDRHLSQKLLELIDNSNGKIRYHGPISQEKLHKEISNSDLYIAISKWDTFNLAVIQAMNLGVPCLCSHQAGVSELLNHSKNGFIVDINSASLLEDCTEILESIEGLGEAYDRIRQAAYETALQQDWSSVTKKYLKFASS